MPENAEKQHDPDATIPMAAPVPTAGAKESPDLPLPEELTLLLPHGNYSVDGFLGQGGMGAVYKGTQVRLQRKVAIKIMRRDQGKDHGFEERFRREALALAQLNHPNIVNVIDYGEAGPDYLYIVMEFVDGTDLVGVIRSGQMTQETALKLLPQICDALQFAHDNGIVHRDIKPANILLTRDGRIKMADFGLAKRFDVNSTFHTQTGAGMGTPDYAAPEQFDPHGNVDHRADIYALGVMIYQMVTGQLPRGAWKPPSEKADVDAHWDKIVSHALQTDPSDRYASVSEIKTDISCILLPISGQGAVTGNAVSRKSGFSGKLGGSTTVLTQAGGRSVSQTRALASAGDVQPTTSSRARVLMLMAATLVVLAVGGYFGWEKFKPSTGLATSVEVAKPAPPAPIRLWDAADKIPKEPGVAWEDDALRLDKVGVSYNFSVVHRVAVKASIRVNPDTGGVNLNLLQRFRDAGGYFLTVDFAKSELSLGLADASDKDRLLKVWKMPRQYRPGEWLPVELRVAEGEVSVSLEGKLLGSVHDSALSDFSVFSLWCGSYVHFRDIEFVPLDPSWTNQPPAPPIPATVTVAETVQRPVPNPAAWVDATPQVRDAVVKVGAGTVQGDWLVLSKRFHRALLDGKIRRDAAVRMSFKGLASITLRSSSETSLSYRCVLNPSRTLGLCCSHEFSSAQVHFNKVVKLEPDFDLLAEHELVMAAEEDLISVWLDGRLMLSQRDGNLAQGQIGVIYSVPGNDDSLLPHVRKVEYGELDPGKAPETSSVSTPATESWVNVTDQFQKQVLASGAGKVEDGLVHITKESTHFIEKDKVFDDVALRVVFRGRLAANVRIAPPVSYAASVEPTTGDCKAGLFQFDQNLRRSTGFGSRNTLLGPEFDPQQDHELVLSAVGDRLNYWMDGRLILSAQDAAITKGGLALGFYQFQENPASVPKVRKVEYAELDGTAGVPAASFTTSRTWQAPQPTVTAGTEWTNLTPHIQPQRDVIRGSWTVDKKGLTAKRAEWAVCNIPVQDPGTDYDLRYEVTRGEGSHLAMFFAFRKGSTGGYVPIDYIYDKLPEFADGQRWVTLEDLTHLEMRDAATIKAKRKEWLPRGKECTVLIQVREKEVIVSVNDEEAFRWPADWSKLQQRGGAGGPMFLDVTGGPIFGVGIFNCEAVFHSIEMRKVSAAPFGEPGSIPHLLTSPDYEWTAPVNLGPLVNSPNVDLGPMVSPDGLHLVFSSLREGEAELFESRRPSADEPWSKPSRVFPAIEEGHQDQPWMSPDELRLIYHATTGPGHHGKPTEGDIYFRQRPARDQPWPPPVNLGSKINHPGHDVAVRLSNDERTLLFTSTRPGGQGTWDVWQAKRTSREALFDQAENIGSGLNTADADFHATFAADDRTLLFLRGSRDLNFCRLFMATPDAKGQYQTTALDFPISGKLHNPWLSADGRTLWFAWNGPGSVGDMDLWEIRRVPKAKRESAAAGGSSITPANTTKDAPFTNTLGMKFLPVPITGGPTDGKRVLFSVWETRVQDYEAFVKDTKRAWSKPNFEQAPDHPAVDMIWDDATAFCTWLTEREHKAGKLGAASRYRLPTDHEWSCAVGIAPQEDAAKSPAQKDRALVGLYPWGTAWPPPVNSGNYAGEEMIPAKVPGRHPSASPCMGYRDAHVETAPAGSFPANALGLHDLGGSVWEWCEDWYDDSKAEHVLRGCAYIAGDQGRMLSSARNPYRPTAARSIYFGFRCVLVLSEGN